MCENLNICKYCKKQNETSDSMCEECEKNIQICRNTSKGCTFKDIITKISKHESYFCKQIQKCSNCNKPVNDNFLDHYKYFDADVISEIGSIWRANHTGGFIKRCLLTSNVVGSVICWYVVQRGVNLFLYTALKSNELQEYRCTITITNPISKQVIEKELKEEYDRSHDWSVVIEKERFIPWSYQFEIQIDIILK